MRPSTLLLFLVLSIVTLAYSISDLINRFGLSVWDVATIAIWGFFVGCFYIGLVVRSKEIRAENEKKEKL